MNHLQNQRLMKLTSSTQEDKDLEYFGYNFLKKDISFFDNIPTH